MQKLSVGIVAAILCGATPLVPAPAWATSPSSVHDEKGALELARQLGTSFAESFYTLNPEQAVADIHPALSKLGVIPNYAGSGKSALQRLTPGTLDAVALALNADGHIDPSTATTGIELLDHDDDVIVFKLVAATDWFDYFLAIEIDGRWQLLNCVYGNHSARESSEPELDHIAVEEVARELALAISQNDSAMLDRVLHPDFERRSKRQFSDTEYVSPEFRDSMEAILAGEPIEGPLEIQVLGVTEVTAAVKLTNEVHSEWVFLLKLDGEWVPVNSYWERVAT